MKNFNNTIGNRTRDLPALSVVPQPTAPSRSPSPSLYYIEIGLFKSVNEVAFSGIGQKYLKLRLMINLRPLVERNCQLARFSAN